MDIALDIAATGMDIAQKKTAICAHNIANIETNGFKRFYLETADLPYDVIRTSGIRQNDESHLSPVGLYLGMGAKVIGSFRILSQGNLRPTDNPLDVAITRGPGYFQIRLAADKVGYTRHGVFQKDPETGLMITSEGYTLEPNIDLSNFDPREINITQSGKVTVKDVNGNTIELGDIMLYTFPNERGLEPLHSNFLTETIASGAPTEVVPSKNGVGILQQGSLEESNVDATKELTSLITAQRAYEMNSKIMSAVDKMLQTLTETFR